MRMTAIWSVYWNEIGKTYMRHQDSWLLLYMILQIDGRYKNPYKRLEVLEQQFEFETHGVMFYLEGLFVLQAKPITSEKAWQNLNYRC